MAPINDINSKRQQLMTEWGKKPPNLPKCGELLDQLKVMLTQLKFLPTTSSSCPKQDLIVARDILEVGAFYSIRKQDIVSFERYLAQLKCYYFDYQNELPDSAYKYELLGLNLLRLLSQYRVAEFHTELELLPPREIQSNIYISHPVSIEQFLMEGSYNKVFVSKDQVPSDYYKFFIYILLETIRGEIATCIEQTYENISVKEADRLLFFDSQPEFLQLANKQKWTITGNNLVFTLNKASTQQTSHNKIPAENLAAQTIEYARELEMIV